MFRLILLQAPELHLTVHASDLWSRFPTLKVTGVSAPSVIIAAATGPSAPSSDRSALLRPLSQVLEHPSHSSAYIFFLPTILVFVVLGSDLGFNIQYQ